MSNNVINNSFENEKLENEACDKFENLINSFSTESHSDGEKAVQFPNEYGGAFYADGKLNICVTNVSEVSTLSYNEIIGDNNVNYIKCAFSYNYLLEVNNYIVNLMSDNDTYNINTVGITQKNNVVNVTVSTPENAEALKNELLSKGFDESSFNIAVNELRPSPVAIYARPGDRVYTWTSNTTKGSDIGTIGFNAISSDGISGYVTAEHALWNNKYLGIYECCCSAVGDCIASKSTDSCFVPFSSSIAGVTGLISNSGLYGNTKYQLTASYLASTNLEGETLTGFGKTSKKYTGVVKRTSVSYPLKGGEVIKDALELSTVYKAPTNGDSGGPIVKIKNASVSPQTATLAGIMSATSDYTSTSGNYTLAYVPKVKNITNALGVTFYGGSD